MAISSRRLRVWFARAIVAAVMVLGCGCGMQHVKPSEADVHTGDGLACRTYLIAQQAAITDVVLSMDGTGTGTSAWLPDELRDLVKSRPVAVVRFDKPGVRATFGKRSSVTIDDAPFERHTQGTLVDCAKQAIELVEARFGRPNNLRWHLRGHSEGALVALSVYHDLLDSNTATADRVASLILSGLALEPFQQILQRQTTKWPDFARAVAACDGAGMRKTGLSCAYLRDAAARPSGREMFERIAAKAPRARIVVFAGRYDEHTPARFVGELEAWNAASGHLPLEVHYYDGAHNGSPEAKRELHSIVLRLVAPPP
jgi:pimeloyl-ACP methyl ester carboxylesterase